MKSMHEAALELIVAGKTVRKANELHKFEGLDMTQPAEVYTYRHGDYLYTFYIHRGLWGLFDYKRELARHGTWNREANTWN